EQEGNTSPHHKIDTGSHVFQHHSNVMDQNQPIFGGDSPDELSPMQVVFTENTPIVINGLTSISQTAATPVMMVPLGLYWYPMQQVWPQIPPHPIASVNQTIPLTYLDQSGLNLSFSNTGAIMTNGAPACMATSAATHSNPRKRKCTLNVSTQTNCEDETEIDFSVEDLSFRRKEKRKVRNRKSVDRYQEEQKIRAKKIEQTAQDLQRQNERLHSQSRTMESERHEMYQKLEDEFYRIISDDTFSRDKSEFCEAMKRLFICKKFAENNGMVYSIGACERLLGMYKIFIENNLTTDERLEIQRRIQIISSPNS
uniref:BZIP domain-containing protein n=1 Tax=Clytia hemisphaerica TaxID=252671 RepID=A0A7M5XLF8_9CNID